MESKSLLIIGGSGFFGKTILDYFRNCNSLKINKIIIFSKRAHKIEIDKAFKKKIKIIKISGNILNIKKLPSADYVIYAAILKNYDQDLKAVKNYFNLSLKYHFNSKILYISSGAIYGIQKSKIKEFKEDYLEKYKKINFKNGYKKKYSEIKLKSENFFKELGNKGLKVSIARCFAFVGKFLPRKSNYVVGNFIQSVLDRQPIKIKADYGVVRSYMHSDDLVEWLLKILNYSNKNCPIFNVGSDDPISIYKLADFLGKMYNLDINFASKIITKKILDKYVPDIKKAKKELNLKINYSTLDAVIKTIDLLIKKDKKINI